jgi:flagellar brake protein
MAEFANQATPEQSPPHFELEQSDEYSEFLLHSKAEILSVLRSLIQKGAMITVHFDHGKSFLLTSVIALSTDNTGFILDIGSDDDMNRKALLADKLIFTTFIDKVKVQFSLNKLLPATNAGRPAFLCAIPEKLLRLQRREYFRLSTPIVNPVILTTTLKRADQSATIVEVPLLDISGGGVGLMVAPNQSLLFQKGDILNECKVMLPEEGLLITNLCVRNMFDVTTRSGARHVRVGCEFVGLPAARLTAVQRYITRIERERKARLNGTA